MGTILTQSGVKYSCCCMVAVLYFTSTLSKSDEASGVVEVFSQITKRKSLQAAHDVVRLR